MESLSRKPLQGITNIIRFNWHFYLIAVVGVIALFICISLLPPVYQIWLKLLLFLTLAGTISSLAVSWYVYDHSNIYALNWLDKAGIEVGKHIVNINAGFDETSHIIAQKYQPSQLTVLDFYDPKRHTEVSIARARKVYSAYPGTIPIQTSDTTLAPNSADYIFILFAAHEIRNPAERIAFFNQINNSLAPGGKIIVFEHLRDTFNFMAYNVGFFHFYPRSAWANTFKVAGLNIQTEIKVTPFLTAFILQKNGTAS